MTSSCRISSQRSKFWVRGEHRRRELVAPVDELKEEDGTTPGDREVAHLVDNQECRAGQGLEAPHLGVPRGLSLLERVDLLPLERGPGS